MPERTPCPERSDRTDTLAETRRAAREDGRTTGAGHVVVATPDSVEVLLHVERGNRDWSMLSYETAPMRAVDVGLF